MDGNPTQIGFATSSDGTEHVNHEAARAMVLIRFRFRFCRFAFNIVGNGHAFKVGIDAEGAVSFVECYGFTRLRHFYLLPFHILVLRVSLTVPLIESHESKIYSVMCFLLVCHRL